MALRYYDDALSNKISRWMPDNRKLRILKPSETRRLFETTADDTLDNKLQLPCIALSREADIHLLMNTANARSYDGLRLEHNDDKSTILNMIPVKLSYQLDIFAKEYDEADEYLRQFLFKLINNPVIHIEIPYLGSTYTHIANIRVLDTVSDTSDISERLYSGQFTRWTINLEILDAFLFDIAYKDNWKFVYDEDVIDEQGKLVSSGLDVVKALNGPEHFEDFSDSLEVALKTK